MEDNKDNTDNKTLTLTKKVKFSLILIVILLGIPLLIEGIVYLTMPYISSIHYIIPGHKQGNDEHGAALFEGDPLLGWRLKANRKNTWWDFTPVFTTRQRLRDMNYRGRKFGKKKSNTLRIICLGDSVTFGYRVPLVWKKNPEKYNRLHYPYPELLRQKVQEHLPERNIEVVPMAVPGYTSYQGLNWLKRDIKKYDPDLVIVCFGWNDTDKLTVEDKVSLPKDDKNIFAKSIVMKSQTLIHLSRLVHGDTSKETKHNHTRVHRVSSIDYTNNMRLISELVTASGAAPLFLGQVYMNSIDNPRQAKVITHNRNALRSLCEKRQYHYLQFEELIETYYPQNKYFFGETIHPSSTGHEIMADGIFDYLVQNKLIN